MPPLSLCPTLSCVHSDAAATEADAAELRRLRGLAGVVSAVCLAAKAEHESEGQGRRGGCLDGCLGALSATASLSASASNEPAALSLELRGRCMGLARSGADVQQANAELDDLWKAQCARKVVDALSLQEVDKARALVLETCAGGDE